jgi:hypothetical protein
LHVSLKKNPSAGAGVSPSPPLRETSNGSVLTISPGNYRRLNTPRQLCGFAGRAGKVIWEIHTFPARRPPELCFLTSGHRIFCVAVCRISQPRQHRRIEHTNVAISAAVRCIHSGVGECDVRSIADRRNCCSEPIGLHPPQIVNQRQAKSQQIDGPYRLVKRPQTLASLF